MKTIELLLSTETTSIKKTIEFHANTGLSKVVGSSINSIFEFNERLRKYSNDYIKATEAVDVLIKTGDDELLDSVKLNSEYGFKLKFGKNAKSKRKFASCLNDLITWAAEDVKLMTIEELIKKLNAEVAK